MTMVAMVVLVSAASRHDATWEIAAAIARSLAAHGIPVDLRQPEDVADVEGYDAVVLGSSIYMGRWLGPARHLVQGCQEALRERPVWLFSSAPVGAPDHLLGDGQPGELSRIVAATGARRHLMLPGRRVRSLGVVGAGGTAARRHDADVTSSPAVEAFAAEIAEALVQTAA